MKYQFLLYIFFFTLSVTGQTVYKTPSGEKYHLGNCRMVKNTSQEISIDKALEIGLTSCKLCKPPSLNSTSNKSSNLISNKKAKGQSTTVQCKGQTKKGTRCKHKTSIADGFCYQHKRN